MKKALILTVGTGTRKGANMVDPLCIAVKQCNPNFTLLVATTKSRPHASEIVKRCGFDKSEYGILKLKDEDDLEKTYLDIERAISAVKAKGYEPGEIDVDFTSGTKPMSAAGVLAAIRHECKYLRYVSGQRADGIVISGREKPGSFPTGRILALKRLDLANSFLKQLQFGAAGEIINSIKENLENNKDKKLAKELSIIAAAYDRWDKFDHGGFLENHKKVSFSLPSVKPFKIKKRTRELLGQLVRANKRGSYSFWAVADLLNNAERRAFEGKFDDAVARVYRAVEMLGQYRLQEKYEINSGSADLQKLSDEELESLHLDGRRKEPAKIALVQVFRLLAGRKDKIGLTYEKNKKLYFLLTNRNSSILAHGNKPIREPDYNDLLKETLDLCRMQDRKIDSIRRMLQFPWLDLKAPSAR